MLRFRIGLLTLVILISATQIGCEKEPIPPVVTTQPSGSSDQISDWIEQLTATMRAANVSGPEASRIIAYSSIAYYESYAGFVEEMPTLVSKLTDLDQLPTPDAEATYNYGVIAEAAMIEVLNSVWSDAPQNIQTVLTSTYSSHIREYETAGLTTAIIDRSVAFGAELGSAIVAWSMQDGYDQMNSCSTVPPGGVDSWIPTPPSFSEPQFPCWGDLRPFSFSNSELESVCAIGEPESVDTSTSVYGNNLNELLEIKENLNPEQIAIARFWDDGPGTFGVSGHYLSILGQLIDSKELSSEAAVMLFAQVGIGLADTYIAVYNSKYAHFTPRPVSVVQNYVDMNWDSEMACPATPEFPSTRSTVANSMCAVFTGFFGVIEVRDNTYESILGIDERVYPSFLAMAQETGVSRLYAGTNLRSTIEATEEQGVCIGQRVSILFTQ